MEKIVINWENMDEYTMIPKEYRFVDKIEVQPWMLAKGQKFISSQGEFFKADIKKNPVIHHAFLMEAVMQTGTFIITTMPEIGNRLLIFSSCESAEILGNVCLGDILDIEVSLLSYRHGIIKMQGWGGVNGLPVIYMKFTLVLQEGIVKGPISINPCE